MWVGYSQILWVFTSGRNSRKRRFYKQNLSKVFKRPQVVHWTFKLPMHLNSLLKTELTGREKRSETSFKHRDLDEHRSKWIKMQRANFCMIVFILGIQSSNKNLTINETLKLTLIAFISQKSLQRICINLPKTVIAVGSKCDWKWKWCRWAAGEEDAGEWLKDDMQADGVRQTGSSVVTGSQRIGCVNLCVLAGQWGVRSFFMYKSNGVRIAPNDRESVPWELKQTDDRTRSWGHTSE